METILKHLKTLSEFILKAVTNVFSFLTSSVSFLVIAVLPIFLTMALLHFLFLGLFTLAGYTILFLITWAILFSNDDEQSKLETLKV